MADVKTEQEPSIEEILESIRQIISEDGDQQQAASPPPPPQKPVAAAPPPPPPRPVPQPKPAPENVLDLTERVQPDNVPQIDLQDATPEETTYDSGSLLSDPTADAAAAAMAKLLAGNVAVENQVPGRVGNVTLEDMARDLMRPLIKSWLDQNLPRIIEKMVAKEIEKISRLALKQ